MKALILAGGLGSRLQTIVSDRPKPMAFINNKPFLEYQIDFLKKFHIREIVLCIGHLADQIQNHFEEGRKWNVSIEYAIEESPLGTGGAIKNAAAYLDSPFLVLNGDSFFKMNLKDLTHFHESQKARLDHLVATVALTRVQDMSQYGSVVLDGKQRILKFTEKSKMLQHPGLINAGIYLLDPAIFQFISSAQKISLEREVFPALLKKGYQLAGYPSSEYFVDIGTPAGYHKFQTYVREHHI